MIIKKLDTMKTSQRLSSKRLQTETINWSAICWVFPAYRFLPACFTFGQSRSSFPFFSSFKLKPGIKRNPEQILSMCLGYLVGFYSALCSFQSRSICMFRQLFIHSWATTTHIDDPFITPIHEYMQIQFAQTYKRSLNQCNIV